MKNRTFPVILISAFLSVISFTACNNMSRNSQNETLASHIDISVKPGNDFFSYANGKWIKENPIPESESSNGLWQQIGDTINAQVRKICESSSAIANPEKGSNKQKIGDFYYSGMDSISLNNKGITDLKPFLEKIDQAKNIDDIIALVSWMNTIGSSPLFSFYISQDDKNSANYAVFLSPGRSQSSGTEFLFRHRLPLCTDQTGICKASGQYVYVNSGLR